MSENLFVLALGLLWLVLGFAGTRFMRVVFVCARQVLRCTAIAGGLYLLCIDGRVWRGALSTADEMRDALEGMCLLVVGILTIEPPATEV